MKHMKQNNDALIVGAGLSGLATGIRLLKMGKTVTIVEQKKQAGGLLRTTSFGGKQFEIGCNDFGGSIKNILAELGVKQEFEKVKTKFIFKNQEIRLPLDLSSKWALLYPLNIAHLFYNIYVANEAATLGTVTRSLPSKQFRNIFNSMIAYFLFKPVDQISIPLMKIMVSSLYSGEETNVPIGGSKALTKKLVDRFTTLGGNILYHTKYVSAQQDKKSSIKNVLIESNVDIKKTAEPTTKILKADIIISSVHGWKKHPKESRPALSVASLLIVMDKKSFEFPKGFHTLIFLPEDVEKFFNAHENGKLSKTFGFHLFPQHPKEKQSDDKHAISVYFLSPRDMKYTKKSREEVVKHIIEVANHKFPGFKKGVQKTKFISPKDYQEELNMNSCLLPRMSPNFHLPCYDEKEDMYYIGNAVNPPHATAAFKSAKNVVTQIIKNKKWTCPNAYKAKASPKSAGNTSYTSLCLHGALCVVTLTVIGIFSLPAIKFLLKDYCSESDLGLGKWLCLWSQGVTALNEENIIGTALNANAP